jgi:hypothetical protein
MLARKGSNLAEILLSYLILEQEVLESAINSCPRMTSWDEGYFIRWSCTEQKRGFYAQFSLRRRQMGRERTENLWRDYGGIVAGIKRKGVILPPSSSTLLWQNRCNSSLRQDCSGSIRLWHRSCNTYRAQEKPTLSSSKANRS